MKVELGKIHENKTKQFLVPGLKMYGETFITKLSDDLFKLSYGIHDSLLDDAEILKGRRPIFIMIDKAVNSNKTWKTVEWFQRHPSYITDYGCDYSGVSRKHMLVLEYPEELSETYDNFLKGDYSKMYTPELINKYFTDKTSTNYKVLTKSADYMPTFIKKIEEVFEVIIEDKTPYTNSELDFPILMNIDTRRAEIFNL